MDPIEKKFNSIREEILQMSTTQQKKIFYYILGLTNEVLERPSIEKKDILEIYEQALNDFGNRNPGNIQEIK